MIGNDGGLDISWDQGKSWDFVNTMATGLAYWVSADMRRPYYVYIGLQDNGSWGGPSATRSRNGIINSDWFGIGGGDGFQTAVDPTDPTSSTPSRRTATRTATICAPAARRASGRVGPASADAARRRWRAAAAPAARLPVPRRSRSGGQAVTPQQQAAPGGGGRGGAAERAQRRSDRRVPLQLEHAVHAVAAQSEHRLARRQPAVQVVQPRRHVGRERRT